MTTTVSGSYPAVNSDSDATINGLTVGKGGGAVSNNTAIGASSLNATNTGTGLNTAVGAFSLFTNTSGSESVAVGYEALRLNTTGTYNVALGQGSLRSNTTANENTAVGNNSMRTNTTGASNSALGAGALFANTTASFNTAVGYQALAANTTGAENTSMGYNSLDANTTGANNAAFGLGALGSNTTASNNSAFGHSALGSNTTGAENTALGRTALQNATTGSGNTAIGEGSGNAITTGGKNTILGRYSGNGGGLDIRTASNYIVLSDGDGNPRSIINENGVTWVGSGLGNSTLRGKMTTGGLAVLVGGGTQAFEVWDDNDTTTARFRVLRSGTLYAQGVYSVTTASAANVNVASDGGMARSTSSLKYKTNVQNSTHGLAEVMQLRPVTYKGINDGELVFGGLIAEEVDAVGLSEFVQYADDGSPDALAYGNMVSLCIKAIQELNQKVEAQALEIAQLKGN